MAIKTTNQETTPQAVEDCHQLLLWLIPLLDQFPRQRRFTLGERLASPGVRALTGACSEACGVHELVSRFNRKLGRIVP